MASADVLQFLPLPSPFSLRLADEACALFPELDQMEGSPMELPPLPVLPWLDLIRTIDVSMDDEPEGPTTETSDVPIDLEDEMSEVATPVTHGYSTRRTAAREENVAQRTIYDDTTEKDPDTGKPIGIDPQFFRLLSRNNERCINEDYLTNCTPPQGVVGSDTKPYKEDTGAIGKYLIERKFPLIGAGSHTLVFLIEKDKVAKVARYALEEKRWAFRAHRKERSLDVMHFNNHPHAFAGSWYYWVKIPVPADLGITKEEAWFDELFVQERVLPLGRRIPNHGSYSNAQEILVMRNRNLHTSFDQWGVKNDGETQMRKQTLLCFDYH